MPPTDSQRASGFLARHGLPPPVYWSPLREGGNNRLYRLEQGREQFVLKCYFASATDPRDRFGAEKAFYALCQAHLPHRVPEALAWDGGERLGLFRFVQGRKLRPEEIDDPRMEEAAGFISALNAARDRPQARSLPTASEACFSLEAHLGCVDRRVARVQGVAPADRVTSEAATLAREQLAPAWTAWRSAILRTAGGRVADELPLAERCVSPSDFGFHNALVAADGRLRFLDFEYAGWDDPAKLVCDFFCQPEIPVDPRYWDFLIGCLPPPGSEDRSLNARCRLLWPAYRIKWCCILLNEFLQGDRERREFAHGGGTSEERLQRQLNRAREVLASLPPP